MSIQLDQMPIELPGLDTPRGLEELEMEINTPDIDVPGLEDYLIHQDLEKKKQGEYELPKIVAKEIKKDENHKEEEQEEKEEKGGITKIEEYIQKATPIRIYGAIKWIGKLTNIRPDSLYSYFTHITGMEKHGLIKLLEEKNEKDLAELVKTGAEASPILLYLLGKKPDLFKPDKDMIDAIKALGYNSQLTEKELDSIASLYISWPLFKKHAPFTNTRGMNFERMIGPYYKMPSTPLLEDLSYQESEEILRKIGGKMGELPTYDPRLDPQIQELSR